MSKRGQKTTSNEGSPTAKAKPCLVLREREHMSEDISSQSLGSRVNLENADERKEVVEQPGNWCSPTQIQNSDILKRVDKGILLKQAGNWCWRIKNQTERDERKYSDSKISRKLCSSITRTEKHGIHEPSLHEQDLSVFAEEIGNVCKQRNILNGRIQNKCIDMEHVYDFVDASRHSSWAEFFKSNSEIYKNRILRVCSTLLKSW